MLDVPYFKLLMQRLGQHTSKLLIAPVSSLFYLTLGFKNKPENSSEPQCLTPNR